jgi:hypothetical protein
VGWESEVKGKEERKNFTKISFRRFHLIKWVILTHQYRVGRGDDVDPCGVGETINPLHDIS